MQILTKKTWWQTSFILSLLSLLIASPALAHHPFGGRTPSNFIEGFLSGLGHPVIGLDHFAFVIASGLLAALMFQGVLIPIAFVFTSLLGTILHVMAVNLPALEISIATSVLIFGGLLAVKTRPNSWIVIALAAFAGIFHGYAYGEAIIGAGMPSLVAYLAGFALIQLGIAIVAYRIARSMLNSNANQNAEQLETTILPIRFAGFLICGVGIAFLSSAVLG